ncbi:MAG: hypothetical protein M3Q68_08600 [Actinomycetota bacterium]|nr:hypothetical protein [Actinomycetota bacterium]
MDTNDETGGQWQQDRLAQLEERCNLLEDWNLQQEEELFRIRQVIAAIATATQAVLPTKTV